MCLFLFQKQLKRCFRLKTENHCIEFVRILKWRLTVLPCGIANGWIRVGGVEWHRFLDTIHLFIGFGIGVKLLFCSCLPWIIINWFFIMKPIHIYLQCVLWMFETFFFSKISQKYWFRMETACHIREQGIKVKVTLFGGGWMGTGWFFIGIFFYIFHNNFDCLVLE